MKSVESLAALVRETAALGPFPDCSAEPGLVVAFQAVLSEERRAASTITGRVWAVFMLARSIEVAESILRGRPVMVRGLDPEALRRALRGMPLPAPNTYIRVRHGHLDAIAECGPLTERRRAA